MRKGFYFLFMLTLMAGVGCAITDYGVITDNNQSNAASGVVNTQGKAHVRETSQIATIWPDGTDELFTFVDQQSDGTATLTTYNNFSSGSEPTFHDDLYCNPDWSGCSIFTAKDNNDSNLFDGRSNANCTGARSLSLLLGTGRYYGECGRAAARMSIDDKVRLASTGVQAQRFGIEGMLWSVGAGNTMVTARNLETGAFFLVPTVGIEVEHFFANNGNRAATWLDHPMIGTAMLGLAGMLRDELYSEGMELTVHYNGVETSFLLAGGKNDLVQRRVLLNSRRF
jgi:hypothetical protein